MTIVWETAALTSGSNVIGSTFQAGGAKVSAGLLQLGSSPACSCFTVIQADS